jgi:FixJ family two-component response regulator
MAPRGQRLLLLADDARIVERLTALVRELGRSVLCACGQPADLADTLSRDFHGVVLLAERVGGVSGHEILCDLRRAGHRAPVVLLGELDDDEAAAHALRAGAAEYLAWPQLTSERLRAALDWACERHVGVRPSRGDEAERLCVELEGAVAPTLEAARASLECLLERDGLLPDAKRDLGAASELCERALQELARLVDEARKP